MNIFKPDDNQPAIIRSEADAAFAVVKTFIHRTRESSVSLGLALLEAKEKCPHGEWLERLKKVGIGPRSAQYYMERAKWAQSNAKDCVFEAVSEETEVETQPADQTVLQTAPPAPAAPPGPATTPPATPPKAAPFRWNVQCRPCRVAGKPHNPKCKACKAENAPPRDPGDDTKQAEADKNKPKSGAVVWDPKAFNGHIASQTRLIDHVARAGGLVDSAGAIVQTPEIADLHRRLQELQQEVGRFARGILKKLNEQPKSPII